MNYESQKTDKTAEFYDKLMLGEEKRGILGKDTRYNSKWLAGKASVRKYFFDVVVKHIKPTDKVLDFGCGPGTFSIILSSICAEVYSIDISKEFINTCKANIQAENITNVFPSVITSDKLDFEDASFDVIMMVDVIHHLDDIDFRMKEVFRLLKPNGKLLVFEPNKLNPLMFLMHYFDANERGLLRVGTPASYRKLLRSGYEIENIDFNGIVIGPTSKVYDFISDVLNSKFLPFLSWLNPKIFVSAKKRI